MEIDEETTPLPCPFCGSDDIEVDHILHIDEWYIYCEQCGGSVAGTKDETTLITNWNKRSNNNLK